MKRKKAEQVFAMFLRPGDRFSLEKKTYHHLYSPPIQSIQVTGIFPRKTGSCRRPYEDARMYSLKMDGGIVHIFDTVMVWRIPA